MQTTSRRCSRSAAPSVPSRYRRHCLKNNASLASPFFRVHRFAVEGELSAGGFGAGGLQDFYFASPASYKVSTH